MGNSDDDDDTHFCIKCHVTISGLQNYVNHRKTKCLTLIPSHSSPSTSKSVPAEDDYFFSSLCLKSTSSTGVITPGKASSDVGILTRSKTTKNKSKDETKRDVNEFDGVSYVEELQENVVQSYLDPTPFQSIGIEENEITEDESDDEPGNRWMNSFFPPPSHTGGKWKPAGTPAEEHVQRMLMPPPEHTQGKWGPSERNVPTGKTHYWCSSCDRRLGSKLAYNKHIKSKFHLKRSNGQNPEKRKRKPSRKMLEASAKLVSNKIKAKRVRNPHAHGPVICPVCRYKVWPHLMGKHLVSHYHCRRPGDKAVSNAMVLKEIGSIVRQAPFQCGMCKFYCNSSHQFISHWHSEMHLQKDREINGVYLCGFCSFKTSSTVEMGDHLISESHTRVVAVINNSMPIIIYKRTPLKCLVCHETFRFNAQIRNHAKVTNHVQLEGTASDDYQELIKCTFCQNVAHTKLSHQRHLRVKHNAFEYFCQPCNLKFSSAEAARKHRKTASHFDVTSQKQKSCMHCSQICVNMGQLKKHIEAEHPEQKSRCTRCGASFPLKQMLSRHVKEGKCPGLPQNLPTSDRKLSCTTCSFSCDNLFDLTVHSILHGEASPCGTYECPKCHKQIKKGLLRKHVRKHKLGMTHSCKFCSAMFNDWLTLMEHVKENHADFSSMEREGGGENTVYPALQQIHQGGSGRERRYKCTDCTASFYDRTVLSRHRQIHQGKKLQCNHPDCIFRARSNWELTNHVRTHSGDRTFHCQYCSYSSKTKAQLAKHIKGVHLVGDVKKCPHCDFTTQHSTHLKRHLRIHSGAKPYECPYCNYSCNLLENLRKHVVLSKKHPNKSVYECKRDGCTFECNHAKDYKIHLVQEHGERKSRAASYVAGLYRPEQDITVCGSPIIKSKKRKKPSKHTADTSDELLEPEAGASPILVTTATSSVAGAIEETGDSSVFIVVEEPDDDYDSQVHVYGEEFIIDDSFDVDSNEIEIVVSREPPLSS